MHILMKGDRRFKIPSLIPIDRHSAHARVGINRRMLLERQAGTGFSKVIFKAAFSFLERAKYEAAGWRHIRTIGTACLMQLSFSITDKNVRHIRVFNLMCDRHDKIYGHGN